MQSTHDILHSLSAPRIPNPFFFSPFLIRFRFHFFIHYYFERYFVNLVSDKQNWEIVNNFEVFHGYQNIAKSTSIGTFEAFLGNSYQVLCFSKWQQKYLTVFSTSVLNL